MNSTQFRHGDLSLESVTHPIDVNTEWSARQHQPIADSISGQRESKLWEAWDTKSGKHMDNPYRLVLYLRGSGLVHGKADFHRGSLKGIKMKRHPPKYFHKVKIFKNHPSTLIRM